MHAIADGLFTNAAEPQLIGGLYPPTGKIVFPCPAEGHLPLPLRRDGFLWSYTIQRYRPKSPPYRGPEAFSPWVVAYVELPGEAIVEARLTGIAFEDIRIGMPLELTAVPLDPDRPDRDLIPAFRPGKPAA